MRILLAVAAGGFLGGTARYGLVNALPQGPAGVTFAVNVAGSFALAVLLVLALEAWPPSRYLRPFAATGFLGSFTTFSTWMLEVDRLVQSEGTGAAASHLLGTLVAGLLAAFVGVVAGRALVVPRLAGRERLR